ncbi:LOW QUALITY PROTEIN: hypothetical protein HJC23_007917 [Cyclotella cryptica]|uniref:Uncharacterized protein n=1 Tax=Cyclotella cryptica TaxID=29204 RepID=A0ABD3P0N3_9STRA
MKTLQLAAEDAATSGTIRASRKATDSDVNVEYPLEKQKERKVLSENQRKMHQEAFERHLTSKNAPEDESADVVDEKDAKNADRKLYKSKTGLSKLMNDDGYRAIRTGGNVRPQGWFQNDDMPGWEGAGMRDDDRSMWGGSGKPGMVDDRPMWGSGGKGGKGSWGTDMDDWMGGGGKSGKDMDDWMVGGGKSGKDMDDWMGSGGKSGKGSSGGNAGLCRVTVTNLSFKQAFSRMFVMLHEKYVTQHFPIYEFGQNPSKEMCDLTQDLNANGLQAFYNGRPGVDRAWVTSNFFNFDDSQLATTQFLDGGATFRFLVRPMSGYISLAAGFPFANDGGIVLQGAAIFNGAEYYLPAIDSGCEANLQTCWSVPATQADFQELAPRAECAGESLSDTNDNTFGGENFVSIHRGMQYLSDKSDIQELTLLECSDISIINDDDNTRFAKYFRVEGYDDDLLLCASVGAAGLCSFRVDDDFLAFVKSNDDVAGDDDVLIRIARNSNDFNDFCNRIEDINKNLNSAFRVLEPIIFDFRNPIARVSIDC